MQDATTQAFTALGIDGAGRLERRNAILARDAFPSIADLAAGLPPFRSSLPLDARRAFQELADVDRASVGLLRTPVADGFAGLRHDARSHAVGALCDRALATYLRRAGHDLPAEADEALARLAWVGAVCAAPVSLRHFLGRAALQESVLHRVYAEGVASHASRIHLAQSVTGDSDVGLDHSKDGWNESILLEGLGSLRRLLEAVAPRPDPRSGPAQPGRNAIARLRRVRHVDQPGDEAAPDDVRQAGLVVLPAAPRRGGGRDYQEFLKPYLETVRRPVPLAVARGAAEAYNRIAAAWPHAADVLRRVAGGIVEGRPVSFGTKPVLLVGPQGSGKTSFLQEVAGAFGLSVQKYDCASTADGTFAGTSAQWTTCRASVPLVHVVASRQANAVVLLDEIGNGAHGSVNGSLFDALLPFLERDKAKAIVDVGLEVAVDLSAVNYLATANSIDRLPPALRDRFAVIAMPDPDPAHIRTYVRRMLDALARTDGVDAAFYPTFDADEIEVVASLWRNRSLRTLADIVEKFQRGKERLLLN